MNNRNEIEDRVNLYLDKALNSSEEKKILDQRNSDPELDKVFNREQNFRDLLKTSFQRTQATPELIQNIKDKIQVH